MKSKYATVNITDSAWTELEEDFDILSWSVYADVAIYVQEYGLSGWGSSISVTAETAYLKNTSIQKIRIKSQSGNASVNYTLLGFIAYRLGSISGFVLPLATKDANYTITADDYTILLDAPNNSIYYSTDQSALVYKDSGGSVNDLY